MSQQTSDLEELKLAEKTEVQTDEINSYKLLRRLRGWLYWLLPNIVKTPYLFDESYELEHDSAENAHTRVPTTQNLRVPIIWGIELYGPAEINQLYASLRKLNWSTVGWQDEKDSIQNWIRKQRSYGSSGFINIGPVQRREKRANSLLIHNFASLPSEIDSLVVRIHQITPSLTGMLIGFRLNLLQAEAYERELNLDRATLRKRSLRPRGVSIISPENQKRKAVESVRAQLRLVAAKWFKHNAPGYFCNLQRSLAVPTMELLTVKNGPILHEPAEASRETLFGWRWLLANVSRHEIWSHENRSLQLAMDRYGDQEKNFHVTVALDEAAFPDDQLKHAGGKTISAIIHVCNELLDGLLLHVSTIEYLREQSSQLKLTQESLKAARSVSKRTAQTLHQIDSFFDRTIGFPVIARELARKSKDISWYRHDCPKFTAPNWRSGEKPRELSEEVRGRVYFLASHLAEEESVIRAHFEQLSSILSISESVKAQRRMELLTVLALIVAIASLAVALPHIEWLAKLLDPIWRGIASIADH